MKLPYLMLTMLLAIVCASIVYYFPGTNLAGITLGVSIALANWLGYYEHQREVRSK